MATTRSITLNYLERFKKEMEVNLYYADEAEIHEGLEKEIEAIETTIKIIKELEIE